MSYKAFLGILWIGLATNAFASTTPGVQTSPSPGLQAAKRAAYLENSGNLPSRGLAVGIRAVNGSTKRQAVNSLKNKNSSKGN